MEKILGGLRMRRSTMADHALIEKVLDVDDDLSSWEIINQSDDDDDDDDEIEDFSFEEEDDDDDESSDLSSTQSPPHNLIITDRTNDRHPDEDRVREEDPVNHASIEVTYEYNKSNVYYDEEEEEEEEEEDERYDDDDDYDLDDELVPKSVSDRFGRERMRKLGKRAYPKMNKSKRLAYLYNRPGCLHGKHGLGLKHNIFFM